MNTETPVLPDGSSFFIGARPLPGDHWLLAPRDGWDSVRDVYSDCPAPILNHAMRDAVVAAVRYAVRGATMCGKDPDWDPDALVQNAVVALCGLYPKTASVPDYRGYANLGTGQYRIDHSKEGADAELVISIASEEDKAGRAIGEDRDNPDGMEIQPESMAVRLRFANEAGLDALESQLAYLRQVHFAKSQA